MLLEKPKVEFVPVDLDVTTTDGSQNCLEDHQSSQGGGSCIGNQDHSHGEGCYDTAPLIED